MLLPTVLNIPFSQGYASLMRGDTHSVRSGNVTEESCHTAGHASADAGGRCLPGARRCSGGSSAAGASGGSTFGGDGNAGGRSGASPAGATVPPAPPSRRTTRNSWPDTFLRRARRGPARPRCGHLGVKSPISPPLASCYRISLTCRLTPASSQQARPRGDRPRLPRNSAPTFRRSGRTAAPRTPSPRHLSFKRDNQRTPSSPWPGWRGAPG